MSVYSHRAQPPAPAPPASEQVATPPSIVMYVAAFVVTYCGLFAVDLALADASFAILVTTLAAVGFVVSYVTRRQNIAPRNVELPALIVCACVFVMAVASDPIMPMLAPPDVLSDKSKSLAVLLTWLTVFRSFTLINDGSLLFCCVPTLAMIGLVSTMSTEAALTTDFIVLVAASAFLMVHENFLRTRPLDPVLRRPRVRRLMLGSQLQLAALCVLGASVAASFVAVPMQSIGRILQISGGLPLATQAPVTNQLFRARFEEKPEITVGGGPVRLTTQEVLRVKSSVGALWRGATFDLYTGRGWQNTMSASDMLVSTSPGDNPVSNSFDAGAPEPLTTFSLPERPTSRPADKSKKVVQQFRLLGSYMSELYGASEPRIVRVPDVRLAMDGAGTMRLHQALNSGVYEVESAVPDWTPEALMAASQEYPDAIRAHYLQIPPDPSGVYARLRDEALSVTSGMTDNYSKVHALEEWVGKRCKYNTNTPPVPGGVDVVDYFLFTARQGYCDSFATSLAMMCRSLGIPARVANGFLTGDRDQNEYIVRDKDKHQWTEVYFPGYGWISFDSTTYAEDISEESERKNGQSKGIIGFIFGRGWLPPMALLAVLCMVAYVLKVEVWDRLRPRQKLREELGLPETNIAVLNAYLSACDVLARRGLGRGSAETPEEYRLRLQEKMEQLPEAYAPLDRLTALVVTYRYGRNEAQAEDVRIARTSAAVLGSVLKGVGKRQLAGLISAGSA
jgi:transglutaminase-like putative cysteine protease